MGQAARDGGERLFTFEIRCRAIGAVLRGLPKGEVADAYGIDLGTLYRWTKQYEDHGEGGLTRKAGSGRPRKLDELVEEHLREIGLKPASAFGYETDLWTVGRLHRVITERYEADVSRDTI